MAKSTGQRSRRSRGEGAITELPDGRFRGAIWLPRGDGTMHRKYVRGRSRAEVSRRFEALRKEAKGGFPDGTTVADYLATWVRAIEGQNLRPTTRRQYGPELSWLRNLS